MRRLGCWLLAAGLVVLGGCAPPCELREVTGCDFEPAHTEFYTDCGYDFFSESYECRPATRWVPDRWNLIYREGWPRRVPKDLCEREGSFGFHRPRWEFRDGDRYTFHDQPVAECSEALP